MTISAWLQTPGERRCRIPRAATAAEGSTRVGTWRGKVGERPPYPSCFARDLMFLAAAEEEEEGMSTP
ncbi:hypothetical protein DV515_00013421 [Chloebia gouldiae]|uniref:Uncharacterized protein n=1 Tax=Chloebia gouldiae TaxID=44316 RepID=A0A3L8S1E6_CHLGU|nr:hypothetical protein DV515_00013421 [Chloebia gouldiae]